MKTKNEKGFIEIVILIVIILVGFGLFFIVRGFYKGVKNYIENPPPPTVCIPWRRELASLKQGNATSGGGVNLFFVGVASIDSHEYFYFYTGSDSGGYTLEKLKNETSGYGKVVIFEDTYPEHAYLLDKKTPNTCYKENSYEFHIPKGSIIRDFNLK
jgi:hypothetical protein